MRYDYIIAGGGIVGLSTGYALLSKYPKANLLLIEKEETIAAHQTGRNSGVIHSGIYYRPGSLKARFAKEGGKKLIEYCDQHSINYDICGKLIVATDESELTELDKLYQRGLENGLNIEIINKEEMKEIEPNVNGISAIKVPMAGIVNYKQVSESFAKNILEKGGELKVNTKVVDIKEKDEEIEVMTNQGTFTTKYFINCGGLFSDRITIMAGVDPKMKIVPFRGEYYKLKESKSHLVNNLIYPVPDPQFPFLGVHLTRMINGEIHVGPNAVLAFKREGYKKTDLDLNDLMEVLSYPAFWKIAKQHLRYGIGEMHRSVSKKKFLESLRKLVPAVQLDDLVKTESGVRAQALTIDGQLVDDFLILKSKRSIHVCNAPSPAATASMAIGEEIVSYIDSLVLV
ncbi:L-2-hydroxyglutarate oxidase [Peribacillus glennii]|uniref:L-2-hydroxyglutarate oxidase n=1 Tax=Peribacillus glennii TaxID=2303991 RepID=A0A372LET9_9BACI|nr:L-2-hydroxyglutarate oxidase [Peribacillus glennii]RFU64810.1 L-2-hydroxyglutarate oxidase [Peribacillus glennii]